MKKKPSKRTNPYAKEILDRRGPYKPKIIQSKKVYPTVADEFDDWYFSEDAYEANRQGRTD